MIRLKSKCSDDCSQCEPSVIASYTTNGNNPTWDLTPYQGDGVGRPNTLWRLYELSGGVEYNRGRIDENGKLEGLPNQFKSNYTYDGYMELQQGCPDVCCDDLWFGNIKWPES